MNVFELFATLSLDTSGYDEGLNGAEEKGSSFGQKLGAVVGTGAKVAGAALAATGAAAVGVGKAFADGLQSTAAMGDAIDKNSQRLGISAEKYQQLDYVLNIAGTSMSEMTMGMKTLTNQLEAAQGGSEEAQAKFAALGISMDNLATMSREDIFEATISGFQNMEESVERAALANDLLGRSSMSLTPLFNMTNEETQSLIDTANEYGMVMSDNAVKASASFQDSMTTLTSTMSGLKNNLMAEFLPSISTVMDGLSKVVSGDSEGGLGMIEQGVDDFISNLNEIMPRVLEIGGRIISSLITAISQNLPQLLSEGSGVLSEIIQGIIQALPFLVDSAIMILGQIGSALLDNAPLLLQTAVELVLKLANSFAENAPVIIPSIVQVITMIIRTLTQPDTLSALIRAALQIILAIAEGIVAAIPDLVAVIPEVIVNLITVLWETFPDVLEAVFELLGILGMGILEFLFGLGGQSIDEVAETLSEIIEGIGEWGASVIEWFVNIGKSIGETVSKLWTGITDFFSNGFENIKEKVSSGLDNIKNTFSNIFENVKTTVSNALDFLKGLFKFDWELPKIKLPHFTITGGFNLDPTNFSVPKIGVEWYAKAMSTPYLLDDATIFGAASGRLLGGGETGAEMIYGHDQLMRDIGAVVDSRLSNLEFVVPVYIGGKKIDQQIVTANARNALISGGR